MEKGKEAVKYLEHHYSGPKSIDFWKSVWKLKKHHDELYSLGVILQDVEGKVLNILESSLEEEKVKQWKVKRKQ